MKNKFSLISTILLAVISLSSGAAAQTGGQFTIEQAADSKVRAGNSRSPAQSGKPSPDKKPPPRRFPFTPDFGTRRSLRRQPRP